MGSDGGIIVYWEVSGEDLGTTYVRAARKDEKRESAHFVALYEDSVVRDLAALVSRVHAQTAYRPEVLIVTNWLWAWIVVRENVAQTIERLSKGFIREEILAIKEAPRVILASYLGLMRICVIREPL